MLQKSLLSQKEEQMRITALEQQVILLAHCLWSCLFHTWCSSHDILGSILSIFSVSPKIQLSVKEFENEKIDRQSMQHQLQKVLKELRKARDQIAKLESAVGAIHNYTTHWILLRNEPEC